MTLIVYKHVLEPAEHSTKEASDQNLRQDTEKHAPLEIEVFCSFYIEYAVNNGDIDHKTFRRIQAEDSNHRFILFENNSADIHNNETPGRSFLILNCPRN